MRRGLGAVPPFRARLTHLGRHRRSSGFMAASSRMNGRRKPTSKRKTLPKDFEELLRDNPAILLHLSRILTRRLVATNRLAPRREAATPVDSVHLITLSADAVSEG